MKRGRHEHNGPVRIESDFVIKFRNLVEFAWIKGWEAALQGVPPGLSEDYAYRLQSRSASLDKFIRNHADDLIARLT